VASILPPGIRRIAAEQVERLAIHQLDLADLAAAGPTPEALALTVATLDGLAGPRARPSGWDDVTYALKGARRLPLDEGDREFLGDDAKRYPAFG
jgi:hypothetical protein